MLIGEYTGKTILLLLESDYADTLDKLKSELSPSGWMKLDAFLRVNVFFFSSFHKDNKGLQNFLSVWKDIVNHRSSSTVLCLFEFNGIHDLYNKARAIGGLDGCMWSILVISSLPSLSYSSALFSTVKPAMCQSGCGM